MFIMHQRSISQHQPIDKDNNHAESTVLKRIVCHAKSAQGTSHDFAPVLDHAARVRGVQGLL